MLSDDDRAHLAAILECGPALDRWRLRVQRTEPPECGSDLSADDSVFPYHRISEVVRTSLAISGESLRLATDAIHRGNLYPSAHFTALRSALVGACQAVWILAPGDAPTRRNRGLSVIDEAYRRSAQYHDATKNYAPKLSASDATALDDQLAWIATRRLQVSQARTTPIPLNLTNDVIPAAAADVYQDPQRRAEVRLLWMQLSGDAHVLGWSMFMRSEPVMTDRLTGLIEFAARGSVKSIAQPFIASYEILRQGWSLYDKRCEGRDA
ncbi:MAG: hypothetical protein QM711_13905 [Micropruina sp.]|uniref:hypothetical protein n=1 Tax=Micropruina sp. TaxID=2737536 RepID=UPI0039E3F2B7